MCITHYVQYKKMFQSSSILLSSPPSPPSPHFSSKYSHYTLAPAHYIQQTHIIFLHIDIIFCIHPLYSKCSHYIQQTHIILSHIDIISSYSHYILNVTLYSKCSHYILSLTHYIKKYTLYSGI